MDQYNEGTGIFNDLGLAGQKIAEQKIKIMALERRIEAQEKKINDVLNVISIITDAIEVLSNKADGINK